MWGYRHKFGFHLITHVKTLYELMDGGLGHLGIGAGKSLQCLIGVRVCLAAQDGLYGFCHHCPGVVKIGGYLALVENELAQALKGTFYCYHCMTERNSYIAQYR